MARRIYQVLLQSSKVMAHTRMLPWTMAYCVALMIFVVSVGVPIAAISNDDPQYNFFCLASNPAGLASCKIR